MTGEQQMKKVKLSYFDFSGGRGEACRLALYIAGVDFEDDRIDAKNWSAKKPSTPFGAMPIMEIAGKGIVAQSNAILGVIGANHDLLPADSFAAAKHIAVLNACEDLSAQIAVTMQLEDEALKKKMREGLAEGFIKEWGHHLEKQIQGPFFGGEKISVADLKLYTGINWIKKGVLDYIPANTLDDFPKLNSLFDAVSQHPKVMEWYKNH